MKRTEIEKCKAAGKEVAWQRSESWPVYYGVIVATDGERRVYSGSRDFRGRAVHDGIVFSAHNSNRTEIVPANQIKDAAEMRMNQAAAAERKARYEDASVKSKATCENAAATINAALEENGVQGRANVRSVWNEFSRTMTYSVEMSGSVAEAIATVLS